MKNAKLILALSFTLGGLLASAPLSRGADDKKDDGNKSDTTKTEPSTPAKGRKAEIADRFKQIAEKLNLTDEQKAKIRPIMQDEMSKLKAMRDDTSTDRQAKVAKFREIQDASNTKIKAILTPEQTGQFDKLRQDARAKLKKKQDQ